MEYTEKLTFPNLSNFKGQSWSTLTTFLNGSNQNNNITDQSVTNCSSKDRDMDSSRRQKSALEMVNLSQFYGKPWSEWIKNVDEDKTSMFGEITQNPNPDTRVTRLPREDMGLFGICPENDSFDAVLCQICSAVVKAQGLQRHMEIRHPSDETALLPPPQAPVKKSKAVNVKARREPVLIAPTPPPLPPPPTMPPPIVHSMESSMPAYKPILPAPRKPIEISPTTSIVVPNLITFTPPVLDAEPTPVLSNNLPRRKSPNISSDRKSTQKIRDKGYESENKHAVSKDDQKHNYIRQVHNTSKSSSVLRKGTVGRTKDFNKLVAEHRATKETLHLDQLVNTAKPRAQSVLKTAVIATTESSDSGFSSSSSSQSSHPASQETSPIAEVAAAPPPPPPSLSTIITQPLSPAHIYPVVQSVQSVQSVPSVPSMASPVMLTAMGTSDLHLKPSGRHSRTASPVCLSTNVPAAESDEMPVYTCTPVLPQVRNVVPSVVSIAAATDNVVCGSASSGSYSSCSTNSNSSSSSLSSSSGSSPQVLHLTPIPAPQHVYTVKLPGSPLIILSNEPPQSVSPVPIQSVNLNVNTETISATNSVPVYKLIPQKLIPVTRPVVVSRDVIESLNVPVVMQMPPLNDNLTNITVYATYPKPLVVSTFSAKKVGNTVVFSNRRLDFIRSQFKSVLKKARRDVPLRNAQMTAAQQPPTPAPTHTQTQTVYGVRTSNANQLCRPQKQPTSNHQPTSLHGHRPNILRTPSQTAKQSQHMPKILTTGLKRPAPSPQLSSIDSKHMLLNPTTTNVKMIVHQHELTETGDGPATTSHLALEKVVPVNMK